jgi:hypothetical protein
LLVDGAAPVCARDRAPESPSCHSRRRHVALTESTQASPFLRRAGSYIPPQGAVFIGASGSGYLQRDGIQIGIDAGRGAQFSRLRALTPMS